MKSSGINPCSKNFQSRKAEKQKIYFHKIGTLNIYVLHIFNVGST